MTGDELQILYDNALGYGVELSQHNLDLFRIYLDELLEWNMRMNLIGMISRKRVINELFLDSLIPAPFLPEEGRMLDVGSGGGLPGIPFKIYRPQLKTHLMEPNSKKVSFLKQTIRLLSLDNIEVIKGRIDRDSDSLHPDGYHLITSRALAGLDMIIRSCSSHLTPGGLLLSFLGQHAETDLKRSQPVVEEHSLTLFRTIPYTLPGKDSRRTAAIFRRKA
ncbi:MAG: 16S rRNA (guanine(527)-N(7))-methyltransferase RsmG [Deltaproteobacteria bacterium]|nr:16S rRNA (guanine(527)-N(7))-methyltransferase RsmG [Deltaproteobacteria bacterium]